LSTSPRSFNTASLFQEKARRKLENYKYRLLVISGKGGVGKSFVASMLSLALAERGKRVALFDADIYGSSTPLLLGLQGAKHYLDESGEILPVEGPLGVKLVAVNLMLETPDTPVVWRGPLASRAILELAARVKWESGDYLVVDMPPGTGDIAITIAQLMPRETHALIVTAPNALSEVIVAKAVNFATSMGLKLLGVVENMSYFKCPHCGRETSIMGVLSGESLASKYSTQVLAKIPLSPEVNRAIDSKKPYLLADKDGEIARIIRGLTDRIIRLLEK
jgi:ATP-binding protein involved in chromosome partitioning